MPLSAPDPLPAEGTPESPGAAQRTFWRGYL